jgi:hypothetical protein
MSEALCATVTMGMITAAKTINFLDNFGTNIKVILFFLKGSIPRVLKLFCLQPPTTVDKNMAPPKISLALFYVKYFVKCLHFGPYDKQFILLIFGDPF